MPARNAFTLVELLVVVSIIVVLLALLAPALDSAVREAEMTVCAANKHGLAVGVTSYAMDHKRHYPYRQHPDTQPSWPWLISYINSVTGTLDDRPKYAKYVDLNGTFNCPQSPTIDIENSKAYATFVDVSLWHGFQFRNGGIRSRGMMRIGDRLTWDWTEGGSRMQVRSNLLAGSHYVVNTGSGTLNTTHPGIPNDAFTPVRQQEDSGSAQSDALFDAGVSVSYNATYTLSMHRASLSAARKSDQNEAFADLSVLRYRDVDWNIDERMVHVPGFTDGAQWTGSVGGAYEVIPKGD